MFPAVASVFHTMPPVLFCWWQQFDVAGGDHYFQTCGYGKGPKKPKILRFSTIFSAFFPNIWPLAGPNIAEKGWPLLGKAWERVWKGFGKGLETF